MSIVEPPEIQIEDLLKKLRTQIERVEDQRDGARIDREVITKRESTVRLERDRALAEVKDIKRALNEVTVENVKLREALKYTSQCACSSGCHDAGEKLKRAWRAIKDAQAHLKLALGDD
jgi:uncharacterized coiled-coil DUF342 family protein